MFMGQYDHTVDDKGRVAIPARFRDRFADGLVVTRGLERCLLIYTAADWAALAERIATLPLTQSDARAFTRFLFSGAMDVQLDRQGRVVIPGYLREYAGIREDVVIAGANTGRPGPRPSAKLKKKVLSSPSTWPRLASSGSPPMTTADNHVPVLLDAVLAYMKPKQDGVYVDCTVGGGGHARALLAASAPGGRLLGLDIDPEAAARARQALAEFGERVVVVNESYTSLVEIARAHGFEPADGVLLDLGLSSYQLDEASRGFSFQKEAPLDMRFDRRAETTAADLIATLSERRSRALARAIVRERAVRPITTTTQLAELVAAVVHGRPGGVHPATRAFQALRIAVNRELEAIEAVLPQAVEILRPGGRLAVISFHSLEDRIVKRTFQREAAGCLCPPDLPQCVCGHVPRLKVITKRPVEASAAEVAVNPRSRSAKLRVAERLEVGM